MPPRYTPYPAAMASAIPSNPPTNEERVASTRAAMKNKTISNPSRRTATVVSMKILSVLRLCGCVNFSLIFSNAFFCV